MKKITIAIFMMVFICPIPARAIDNGVLVVSIKDYGATGNGIDNDLPAFKAIQDNNIAMMQSGGNDWRTVTVVLPEGNYKLKPPPYPNNEYDFSTMRLVGATQGKVHISTDNNLAYIYVASAENIVFDNVRVTRPYNSLNRYFYLKNNIFDFTNDTSITYITYLGFYDSLRTSMPLTDYQHGDYVIENNEWRLNNHYSALWILNPHSVLVKNNKFSGGAFHNIRVQFYDTTPPSNAWNMDSAGAGSLKFEGNRINGGATGIFIGSNRHRAIEGVVVENNYVTGLSEEYISLDGFGNDEPHIPVIANGPFVSATNDNNGRLVVAMDNMIYMSGGNPTASPVSLRQDWTRFYFTFGQGTGQEGTIARIYSYDNVANTLTLDIYTPANRFTVGGDIGVQGGFFNSSVRGNTLIGGTSPGNTYATGISVYLNVFNTRVENNTITGVPHGISLMGGLMLSNLQLLAWNNIISGNTIMQTDQSPAGDPSTDHGAIRINSLFTGHKQYGNKVVNNTIIGGRIYIEKQGNFVFEGNSLKNAVMKIVWQ